MTNDVFAHINIDFILKLNFSLKMFEHCEGDFSSSIIIALDIIDIQIELKGWTCSVTVNL